MNDSPAQIVQALLTQASGALFSEPADNLAWPLFVSAMPEGTGVPIEVGCVYDTEGVIPYRLLASGFNIQGYGIQIKTRSKNYQSAFAQLSEVAKSLETVKNQTVVVGSNSYVIDTLRQTSPVASIGQDEQRQANVTVNFILWLIESI